MSEFQITNCKIRKIVLLEETCVYKYILIYINNNMYFKRPTSTRTCRCRLQVTSSRNFSCYKCWNVDLYLYIFNCNSRCSLLLIWEYVVTVEYWELHVLILLNIIVLYMYIFIHHRWKKITEPLHFLMEEIRVSKLKKKILNFNENVCLLISVFASNFQA